VAEIKFRSHGYVEVTDNDGRSIVLHTNDILNLIGYVLDCIERIHNLRRKLDDMFEEG